MPNARPMPEICPFLAAASDPDSVLNYASTDNRCHKLGDPVEITADYQAEYCLRARHWFCPVYTGALKRPPVPIHAETIPLVEKPEKNVSEQVETSPRTASRVWQIILGLVLAGILAGGGLYAFSRQNTPTVTPPPTFTLEASPAPTETLMPTPTELPSETPTLTLTFTPTLTETPTFTPTASATATITPTLKSCQIPAGWMKYTVAAGETYFKIAGRYNTTVDALQRVNCLSDPGRLLTGQTIYVPPLPAPSSTASSTSDMTPTSSNVSANN